MKGADQCCENHRYEHSRWRQPEFRSRRRLPSLPSRRQPYPRRHRVVMRPTGDPTAATGRIRATGITRSGDLAGTTATRRPAGYRLSAGHRRLTGSRPPAGIPRQAGRPRQGGSDPAPDRFSICSTRCAARRTRSEPTHTGQAQSRSKIELTMSSPMPMPAPVTIARPTRKRPAPPAAQTRSASSRP
jgi:hypothetical protein